MIIVNQVRCKKCEDIPFSAHRHDFGIALAVIRALKDNGHLIIS